MRDDAASQAATSVEILGEPTDYGLTVIPGMEQAFALRGGARRAGSTRTRRAAASPPSNAYDTSGRPHGVNALAFRKIRSRGRGVAALVQAARRNRQAGHGLDVYDQVALTDVVRPLGRSRAQCAAVFGVLHGAADRQRAGASRSSNAATRRSPGQATHDAPTPQRCCRWRRRRSGRHSWAT
jgi:hypothetical protein